MRPTLEARGLKASLLQYLSTTYALTDEGTRQALEAFLGDDESGMFRGPFLRIRTPFSKADNTWRESLEWAPKGFLPYAHQAIAIRRLSSYGHMPEPTLVTTGTGSGKTESFLLPILDHCRRERAEGRPGIKAILLYPMNALATDQAIRINKLFLEHDELRQVSAGLYIGESTAKGYERVLTRRSDMRLLPPDILITNYKMLDRLLQLGEDVPLWRDVDLRYVVVDEFHTYDGAQGTDVAMLLRRLASVVGVSEPGRPLGGICPVATSATLASSNENDDIRDLLDVAGRVFGTTFTPDAIVGESRQTVEQFVPKEDFHSELPLPDPETLWKLADPGHHPEALAQLKYLVTGVENPDDFALGALLKRHVLTRAVMTALIDGVKTSDEVLDVMWRAGAYSWGQEITRRPQLAAEALARFVALLSIARDPDSTPDNPRPFVHVEVHQWARAVSRLLRGVLPWPRAEFRWDASDLSDVSGLDAARMAPVTTVTSGHRANVFLPAVYCRECGRSGWAVFTPESDDQQAEFDAAKIRRASTSQDKIRIRNLIAATDAEALVATSRKASGSGGTLMVLDGVQGRLRFPDPVRDFEAGQPTLTARDSAFVLVNLSDVANTAAKEDWCPACGERNAIRYLGTGPAALAAASITQLFTDNELDEAQRERKTLMFNDSVQDAAHRAGFVANRSYTFSLRALLTSYLDEKEPIALNDLIAAIVKQTTNPKTLSAVVPPDLHDHQGVARLLSGKGRGGDQKTWRLIGERLAYATVMEFGFRARQGRTLELTRTAAAHVHIPDVAAAVELVRAAHLGVRGPEPIEQDDARYLAFLRIFLEKLRSRGAVKHRWLNGYLSDTGMSRFYIWGRRPEGMPAYPKGVAAPVFLLDKVKDGSDFDTASGRLAWYETWARRCLMLTREQSPEFWGRILPDLAREGLLSVRVAKDSVTGIYGLQPAAISAYKLRDDQVNVAYVRCKVCFWEQTVHPALLSQWHDQPCPSYRCTRGRLVAGDRAGEHQAHHRDRDYREDYYRRLYREAGTYQVVTAEHTGMLTRKEREKVESAFRNGDSFNAPNVLACTPTLELGIDIGDLSAVVLASLPRTPASYTQRVGRAGRRTGNAFLLTIPARRRRDLYFLNQPKEMIAGPIVPPGCHLSAVAILRRQYLAYLLDLAAGGRLIPEDGRPLRPTPRKATQLFGPSGYLADLLEVALAQGAQLADAFLALFPKGVSEQAAAALRAYAVEGLRAAAAVAGEEWQTRYEALLARVRQIHDAYGELNDADEDEARQKAELDAERRATNSWISKILDADSLGVLTELGLLPNYGLIDSATKLEATLYWQSGENPDRKSIYKTEVHEYERPRRFALSEFAPGNTFYVNGYRHEITGLDIGTADRRTWRTWRVCAACGYVRIDDAEQDRSSCPRCGDAQIQGDGSCLFRVVEPLLVTSRDKREDAKIRDDRDERDPRFYEIATAVDMPLESIEHAWRHSGRVFGVDFSRRTMIRTFNLGPARFDVTATDEFAGHTVRLNPFHVCTGCGAATAAGKPVFDHDPDGLTSSAARNPQFKHHRPWCPLRRGKKSLADQVPVLLAHQLETEAVRVLLPAATVLVKEKVHSFRAALRLGVDPHFGGDPAHLDTTIATMPDQGTKERRSYLVLFDVLPGGTGYLHRFTDPEEFRATLVAARDVLLACQCVEEGRKACHRCLHQYTPERYQGVVSRREAIDLIESLLYDDAGGDAWSVEKVRSTEVVGLEGQVESDLEKRFLYALRDWAAASSDAVFDEDGGHSGQLRIASPEGVVHWRVTAQQRLESTRPDFTFTRADGPAQTVQVYLDGRRYHATREHNELAGDASKRTRLRAEKHLVFQLTWDDLDLFEGRNTSEGPVWPPYPPGAQEKAKAAYEQYGGNRAHFAEAIFNNPIATMFAYLRTPELEIWNRRARGLVTGVLAVPGARQVGTAGQRSELVATLRAALLDHSRASSGADSVHVFRVNDLVVALDAADPSALKWTALVILDDDPAVLETDEHRVRWRSWLYWSNLLQFLSRAGGDGVQLTTSQIADYPLEALAVCGGVGELDSLLGMIPEPASVPEAVLSAQLRRDPAWDTEVLPYLDEESEADLAALAEALANYGRRAPVFGHELGDSGWLADFAWPNIPVKIAIVHGPVSDDDHEARRRDAAYVKDGWTIRTATDWLDHLDSLLELLPEVKGFSS